MLLWETFHAYPLLLLLWLPINVESFHLFSHFDLPCQGTHTLIYIKFPLFMVVLWYYNVRYLPQQHLRYFGWCIWNGGECWMCFIMFMPNSTYVYLFSTVFLLCVLCVCIPFSSFVSLLVCKAILMCEKENEK